MPKKRRDTGFIPALKMSEERRDFLRKRDWTKRQEHPEPADNWTTAECIEHKFSGIRINRLKGEVEIWCVGEMRVSGNLQRIANNPSLLATMHEEAFSTVGTVLEVELDVKNVKVRKKEDLH